MKLPGWKSLVLLALFSSSHVLAQELRNEPTPFTTLLDLRALAKDGSNRAALPIWLDRIEFHHDGSGPTAQTTVRLRLRRFGALAEELMLRLFFDDLEAARPTISSWTDTGRSTSAATILGTGIGLSTSETVIIPTTETDYIDITSAGDGNNLHSVFLSSLRLSETRRTLDLGFVPSLTDPFQAPGSSPRIATDDAFLFGRVRATLDAAPLPLSPGGSAARSGVFEFELEAQPSMVLLTFEVLNADVAAPPRISVNSRTIGATTLLLPDFADPGYRGEVRAGEADLRFRYSGWLKSQKVIAGSFLQAGRNVIEIETTARGGAVAIRGIEVQLKYED